MMGFCLDYTSSVWISSSRLGSTSTTTYQHREHSGIRTLGHLQLRDPSKRTSHRLPASQVAKNISHGKSIQCLLHMQHPIIHHVYSSLGGCQNPKMQDTPFEIFRLMRQPSAKQIIDCKTRKAGTAAKKKGASASRRGGKNMV